MSESPLPVLRRAPRPSTVVDLGDQPLVQRLRRARAPSSDERRYPLHARLCETCGLVQVDDVVPPEEIFTDYAYFSSYSDTWVDARPPLRRAGPSSGSSSGPTASSSRSPATTATSSSTSSSAGCRCSASSRPPTWPRWPEAAGIADRRRASSASTTADGLVADAAVGPTSWSPTTCSPTCPTSTTSSPGLGALLAAGRRGVDRGAAPAAPGRGASSSTRSTTSTSPTSRCSPRAGCSSATACGCSTSRSCRPTAAACGSRPRRADDRRRRRTVDGRRRGRPSGPPSSTEPEGFVGFARRVEALPRRAPGVPRRRRATGATGRRLRRRGQGQHPAQLRRGHARPGRLRGRSQPAQAGPAPARYATSRSSDPERIDRDRPPFVLILPWNLRDEITEQLDHIRGWGGRFVVAVPGDRGDPMIFTAVDRGSRARGSSISSATRTIAAGSPAPSTGPSSRPAASSPRSSSRARRSTRRPARCGACTCSSAPARRDQADPLHPGPRLRRDGRRPARVGRLRPLGRPSSSTPTTVARSTCPRGSPTAS